MTDWGPIRDASGEIIAFARADHRGKMAAADEMLAALRRFVRCSYPVSEVINPRGHNWFAEASLDYALGESNAAIAKAEQQPE